MKKILIILFLASVQFGFAQYILPKKKENFLDIIYYFLTQAKMKHINNLIPVIIYMFLIVSNENLSQTDSVAFQSSNLPIVVINTHGQIISDDNRIIVDMGIINNPDSQRNYVSDPFNDYNGRIHVEIRGSSTKQFPKKSYGFETQDSLGNNLNVSLISMPEENDWILYAPYSDKTLLRNELPYHLARSLGTYASRTAYCELILNGEYRGLYVLMEKVKQDKHRVDIAKLNPEDTNGDELTGGYILKSDKPPDPFEWMVDVNPLYGFGNSFYQFQDPNGEKIASQQKTYIQNFVSKVESTLVSSNYADTINGYAKYLDVSSFVDYFLISELAKNPDAYRFSFYMYKKKDSNGGKLFAGPLWDYDLSFANYGGIWEEPWLTYGWNADIATWRRTFWMERLLTDMDFVNKLKVRWNEIRRGVFSNNSIMDFIDQIIERIKEARIRNFIRWPIIGDSVWPNYYVGPTYEAEITFLKDWITGRLEWMDHELTGGLLSVKDETKEVMQTYELSQNYPNPFNLFTTINYSVTQSQPVEIVIFDILGNKIKTLFNGEAITGINQVQWNGKNNHDQVVNSGVYIYRVISDEAIFNGKIILNK
jgi:hypothetical protein